ncbi:CU044_5270 family protein [Actinomadura sp. DC4]|uniref:CU044_5270 family protein n=1 Tax=Actinomadura sp. DC4 TaxID=3055069 RepID=UPI0025B0453B|nr:CU044_5270 family protein [Actinomadura sp. DC4]MDN3356710.1 CU044_5270 family protein [Actinomadura sp. DC4]
MKDIIEQLAEARPDHLDGTGQVDRSTRTSELNRAFAQPRTARRRRRGRLVLPLVAVGAAGAVLIAVSDTRPARTGHNAPSPRALSGILLAAHNAEALPTGKYWFADEVLADSYVVKAKTGDYAVSAFGSEDFRWTASTVGGGDGGASRDLPFRPVSAADAAAWRRAGSPATLRVRVDDHYDTLRSVTGRWTTWKSKLLGGTSDSSGGRFQLGLTVEQLEKLPTDQEKLATLLFQSKRLFGKRLMSSGESASTKWAPLDQLNLVRALLSGPLPPRTQAALMRVLKARPGIREIGGVTDPLGRKGVALAVEFPAEIRGSSEKMPWGSRLQLVFDVETGKYLGYQEILTRPGDRYASTKPGFVIRYDVTSESGWTNTRPTPPAGPPR